MQGTFLAALLLHASIPVTAWFNWVHVSNPGAAFSFLAAASGWQRYVLTIAGLGVSITLLFSLWRSVTSRFATVSYAAIVAGAMGNVIDRVRLGTLVDYLDFHWQQWSWPAFDLADILVVVSVAFLVLSSFAIPREAINRTI
ncbi:MAG: signal peptidase II [Candidimonas sp.]|nr:MAG: signal peptidase II [Candidimonas sp.]TAM25050.1 MAG: signal peptidase II [Candidimonas sp.]